ncbi:hypothetical protein C2E23DRAFT_887886 [Lenzites betulinus]|nr:hypothetical protein C2E23DRAFT_887886 [Lenzites betulinus]
MAPIQPSNVTLLAGPQLLGFFFDWALQGVLSVQIYIYYLMFPRDARGTKCLVYGVFVYEWVQTILITQTAFEIDVYDFGDVASLTAFHNAWFSVTIMCAFISAVVQGYFCWRIWVFSRSKLLVGTIMFLAFGQMCVGIAGGILLHTFRSTAAKYSPVTPLVSGWLICAAIVDVIIAGCMTYYLSRAKTGLGASDALVDRLMKLAIETGTITAAAAIFVAIAFIAAPSTLLYELPALVLAKLYANTLLASLNNRAIMRRLKSTSDGTISLNFNGATTTDRRHASSQGNNVRVEVAHEEYVFRDMNDLTLCSDAAGSSGGEDKSAGVLELTDVNPSTRHGDDKACI